MDTTDAPEPSLERVTTIDVEIGEPISAGETGDGHRLIIPITGGTVSGEVSGTVLDVGADYQLFRIDRPTEVDARYAVETDGGSTIYVRNEGMLDASPEASERMFTGEDVDPSELYFRTIPSFETGDPDLQWLTDHLFVASLTGQPDGVRVVVYRVD